MVKKARTLGILDKLFIGIMAVIFVGIVLHTPLAVGFGTLFPGAELYIKAWKELLMVVAAGMALILLYRRRAWTLLKSPWIILPAASIVLYLLLVPLFFSNSEAVVAGLMIDLRYIAYFMLMVVLIRLYPELRGLFVRLFIAGALIVGGFALLQVFVLPPDVLSVLGYGDATIQPYLTVDQNPDYVRINSTLRGPNPLGAYALIGLTVVAAYWLRGRRALLKRWWVIVLSVVTVGMLVALWTSYSRSALLGAVVAVGLVVLLTVGRKLNRWVWVSLFVVGFAVVGGAYAARDTPFITNVVLHENAGTGAAISSNQGHASSLEDGTNRFVRQPLGAGIGSTGSASLFTDKPVIIENQYLFIAHEAGWIGLVLFIWLFVKILWTSWKRRADWLSLAVLASGVGLGIVGVLLPVWVDDTVAIIWWGLAALAVGGSVSARQSLIKK